MKARVIVMPKKTVLDPQGVAVKEALHHHGLSEVSGVRVGRYLEIEMEGAGEDVEQRLHAACADLLSNPVIEDYALEIER